MDVEKNIKKEAVMKYVPVRKRSGYFPMLSAFDQFFNNFFDEDKADGNESAMAIDLIENEKDYQIKADLPGFNKKDISISIDKNSLIIEANREEKKEKKENSYYRCERYSGNYRRSISLTEECDADSIKADYKNGVLTITIPKTKPSPAKKIAIT